MKTAGALAPLDVKVPAQATTLGPEKTSFFQALQIPTKITKGTIEILNEVNLIKEGERVGQSESTLLNMLNISPSPTVCKWKMCTTVAPSSALLCWTSLMMTSRRVSWRVCVKWQPCPWP